jgi:predicted aldo/keto reductase-like oxidoreductase
MKYRKMGSTGDEVSVLGFGCMRLPVTGDGTDRTKIDDDVAIPMLRKAIDNGVNYVDTAWPYHSNSFEDPGESEPFVGRALTDGYRDKVMVATKLPPWLLQSRDDMDRILDQQIQRMQSGHIDYYLLHGLNKMFWGMLQNMGALEFLDKAKADGRIKRAGFSYHEGPEPFPGIVDAYDWDFCQIQYNYLDEEFQAGKKGLEHAAAKGMGIVVMEPLRGGNIAGELPQEAQDTFGGAETKRSNAEWALRWVWNNPQVSTVLSGMSEPSQVEENLKIADEAVPNSLTEDEQGRIEKVKEVFNAKLKVPCTQCRYCMPCPEGVDIPGNLAAYNEYFLFDTDQHRMMAKVFYNMSMSPENRADRCTACGQCLEHCPQQIQIPDELEIAKEVLGGGS